MLDHLPGPPHPSESTCKRTAGPNVMSTGRLDPEGVANRLLQSRVLGLSVPVV